MRVATNIVIAGVLAMFLTASLVAQTPGVGSGGKDARSPKVYYDPHAFRLENSGTATAPQNIPGVLQRSSEPVGRPVEDPEPTRKLSRNPLQMFNEILTGSPDVQLRNLSELTGEDLSQKSMEIGSDARIESVQLDDDVEPEFVLVVHVQFPPQTRIFIIDKTAEGWNVVGSFNYWYFWDRETAEGAIELHPPFILVRDSRGGSGLLMIVATMFRLWNGRLYKTVELEEWSEGPVIAGSNPPTRENEHSEINFVWDYPYQWRLRVKTEKESIFVVEKGEPVAEPAITRWCLGYEWTPDDFTFKLTRAATQAVCK